MAIGGVSVTVPGRIAALRRVTGEEVVRRIRREPDEMIMRIVVGWPRSFDACRAFGLGLRAETDFVEIISVYVEDELGGDIGAAEL